MRQYADKHKIPYKQRKEQIFERITGKSNRNIPVYVYNDSPISKWHSVES